MNTVPSTICTEHRLSRFVAWAVLMLAWIAANVFSDNTQSPKRRYIRRRYGVSLESMAKEVRNLVIIRATQILSLRPQSGPKRPSSAPAGFVRRIGVRHLRIVAGSALRRRLRAGSLAERLALLFAALRDLDALAAKLAARLKKRLTRTRPLIATRPPHDAARTLAAPSAVGADSS